MKFYVICLFPSVFDGFLNNSILEKAIKKKILTVELLNLRDFAFDKHKTCDDLPYGGGAGMVLKPEPLSLALDSINAREKLVIFPSPSGKRFAQADAIRLANVPSVVFVCGRYEGIDQRVVDEYSDEEFSIGDYVISSGEVASMVMIDAIFRNIPGAIASESLTEESFGENNLLEYPQYTRPEVFRGISVPKVLLSGNHKLIRDWRLNKSKEKTKMMRPDLIVE